MTVVSLESMLASDVYGQWTRRTMKNYAGILFRMCDN